MALINIDSNDAKFVKEVKKASIVGTFLMATLGVISAANYGITRHLADEVTQKGGMTCSHFIDKEKNSKAIVCSGTFAEYAIPGIAALGFLGMGGLARAASRRLRELEQEGDDKKKGNPPSPPAGPR